MGVACGEFGRRFACGLLGLSGLIGVIFRCAGSKEQLKGGTCSFDPNAELVSALRRVSSDGVVCAGAIAWVRAR